MRDHLTDYWFNSSLNWIVHLFFLFFLQVLRSTSCTMNAAITCWSIRIWHCGLSWRNSRITSCCACAAHLTAPKPFTSLSITLCSKNSSSNTRTECEFHFTLLLIPISHNKTANFLFMNSFSFFVLFRARKWTEKSQENTSM